MCIRVTRGSLAFAGHSKKTNAATNSVIFDTSVKRVGPGHTVKTVAVEIDAEARGKEHAQKHVEGRSLEDKIKKNKEVRSAPSDSRRQ